MKKHSLIVLTILFLVGTAFYLFNHWSPNSSDPEAELTGEFTNPTTLPIEQVNSIGSQLFNTNVFQNSEPKLNKQRSSLLDSATIIKEEIHPTNNGYKKSSLLKANFKYPHIQRDVYADKEGKYIREEFYIANHALMKFPTEISTKEIYNWAKSEGFSILKKLKTDSIFIVASSNINLFETETLIKKFEAHFGQKNINVITGIAERDFIYTTMATPNDLLYRDMWGLHNIGQTNGNTDADIDAPEAWDFTSGNSNVVVAVIDTGVDVSHEDLADNIWFNPGEIAGNGIDDDNNGFIDDVNGWDFHNNDNDPDDDVDHGTHCSGTIGGVGNNGIGITGVAWDVSIVPVKFLGPNGGSTSDAIDAINYTTQLGVQLTSNSWGGGGFSSLLQSAIEDANDANILFVAAAGNDSLDNDIIPQYPAGYDLDGIISVAATTDDDGLSSFSNFGAISVDIGAPGSDILSTTPNNTYTIFSGTSMATPHVTGVLCLMKSISPELNAIDLKNHLLTNSDSISSLSSITVTGKRLNAATAISRLQGSFVQVNSYEVEFTSGNGDAFANPGETGNLVLTFNNIGNEEAKSVNATITTNPILTISNNSFVIGDIAPQSETATFRVPFTIANSASTPIDSLFTITTEDQEGSTETSELELSIYTSSTISGRVYNLLNNAPISGALVRASGEIETSTNTDVNGFYTLNVVNGTYDINVSATGFLNSENQIASAPPSLAEFDIGLGLPNLSVTPNSITATTFAGSALTREIAARKQKLFIENSNDKLSSIQMTEVAASSISEDLVGLNFATISNSSNTLEDDIIAAGGNVLRYNFPLSQDSLEFIDLLIIDDAVNDALVSDVQLIREWVNSGGDLILTGDSFVGNNNAILEGTGIIVSRLNSYETETMVDFADDPITNNIESVLFSSYGTTCSVNSSAKALIRNSDEEAVMASSQLGLGSIVYLANETDSITGDDGRTLLNNVVSSLSSSASWISASPLTGSIAPNSSSSVIINLDSKDLIAGIYEGLVTINSNELVGNITTIPVNLTVTGAPSITSEFPLYDFGSIFRAAEKTLPIVLTNNGTDTLEISSITLSNSRFQIVDTLPNAIPAKSSHTLFVSYSSNTIGNHSSQLTINSNSPVNSIYSIELTAASHLAPMLNTNKSTIDVSVPFNGSNTETLTLSNQGGADLNWAISTRAIGGSANSSTNLELLLTDKTLPPVCAKEPA